MENVPENWPGRLVSKALIVFCKYAWFRDSKRGQCSIFLKFGLFKYNKELKIVKFDITLCRIRYKSCVSITAGVVRTNNSR